MNTYDEECTNCGELIEVTTWEDGECTRCGCQYWWEENFDEDYDTYEPILVWDNF